MELKKFVSESLKQILQGVQDAIEARKGDESKGAINPVWGGVGDIGYNHLQHVEFDVAVTVSDKLEGKGGAGLKVFSIELGASGNKSLEHSSVSRIKFKVPIVPPVQIVREVE